MLKKTLAVCAILLSTRAVAESAPNCSSDENARILLGLITSVQEYKLQNYVDDLANNASKMDIKLISSSEINIKERKNLMMRKARRSGYKSEKEIRESGIYTQYMNNKLYKQYYEITTPGGLHVIGEYYSIPDYCAVDVGSIYFISNKIDGSTPNFADK